MRLDTFFSVFAEINFVVLRMIFLFFPAMRMFTPVFCFATIRIGLDEVLGLPIRTLFLVVLIDMGFPPEVLPIVCVDTLLSIVRSVAVRAPDGLEVEHVEVRVLVELVEEVYSYLCLGMGEGAHVAVVAGFQTLGVGRAELQLVLLRVVELFHTVVAELATVSLLALFPMRLVWTSF